jgi:RimJ/RimL family protein N-acetyltransferase
VHAVVRGGQVVAAAGYTTWPGRVAHLSVLTDPAHRGQGLAAQAGSAAAADALSAGLLAQWRARVPASIAVAARLGFVTCGSQLSILPAGLAALGTR